MTTDYNKNLAKETAKNMLEDYLGIKGINTRKNFACLAGTHEDRNPSMSCHKNRVHCFACGYDGDIFDLVGLEYGLTDAGDKFAKTYEVLGISNDDRKKTAAGGKKGKSFTAINPLTETNGTSAYDPVYTLPSLTETDTEAVSYLNSRGISLATAEKYGIKYTPRYPFGNDTYCPAVIIPTGGDSYVARNITPNVPDSMRYRKRGVSRLFNFNTIKETDTSPVFITEGEFDALSVIEAGGRCVGLGSVANARQFAERVRGVVKAMAFISREYELPPLILALDNDAAGKKCADELLTALRDSDVNARICAITGTNKDANEALSKDRKSFVAAVTGLNSAEFEKISPKRDAYLSGSNLCYMREFEAGQGREESISTGFAGLDDMLDGGLCEGLYIVGAISSLGKTTFVLQIADCAAAAGSDIVIFSLEMSKRELIAKSLSRITAEIDTEDNRKYTAARTAKAILNNRHYSGYERELVSRAKDRYRAYAGRIYVVESEGDVSVPRIREVVENHIRYTGNKPVVVVDYIQIIAPAGGDSPGAFGITDKQNMDRAVSGLKRVSRDFNIPVIGISSLNRENYSSKINMSAFKESGAIEYSSDVLLGLQMRGAGESGFDVDRAKAEEPRRVELKVLKNRNGRTGGVLGYRYWARYNAFEEE